MQTAYHAHIDGFSGKFFSVAEIQTWIDGLKAKNNLRGCELKVWRGHYSPSSEEFVFTGKPAFVKAVS